MDRGIGCRRALKAPRDSMDGDLLALHWMEHKNIFSQAIKGLRKKDAFTDATLACEGVFYPVHKFVLSTCSEYFSEIFEWTPCVSPVIVINNILCSELEVLLDFMYNGEANVKDNVLPGILNAANCLRIKGLALLDEDGQKTQLAAKNTAAWPSDTESAKSLSEPPRKKSDTESAPSLSGPPRKKSDTESAPSFSGPPRKKSRQDVKRKANTSRSPTATFKAPPPPRPSSRSYTPARLPTNVQPSLASRPSTSVSRSSTPISYPSTPICPSTQAPIMRVSSINKSVSSCTSLTSMQNASVVTISSPNLTTPLVSSITPSRSSTSPSFLQSLATRVPSHTTASLTTTAAGPVYSGGQVVTPVLNLSLPSQSYHQVQVHSENPVQSVQLQAVSFGAQNQMNYPQVVAAQPQPNQPKYISQPLTRYVASPQAESQLVQHQSRLVETNFTTNHRVHQEEVTHVKTYPEQSCSQMTVQLNCSPYDLKSPKCEESQEEELQETLPSELSPPMKTLPEVFDHQQRSNHAYEEEPEMLAYKEEPEMIAYKEEPEMLAYEEEPEILSESPVIVDVPETYEFKPPEVHIPQLNPIDTLLEAVKMEEQDIIIRTDDGPVRIPEFLDNLEMQAETSRSSDRNENQYEFTEVYPQSAASSGSSNSQADQDSSPSHSESSGSTMKPVITVCCDLCNKTFKSKDGLRRHMKTHTGKQPFACSLCSFKTEIYRDLIKHKQTHAETKACQKCDFTTKNAKEFIEHRKSHTEPFSCPLCDFTSKNVKEYCTHKKSHPVPYQCPHCDHQSSRFDLMKKHVTKHHTDLIVYHCQYCNFNSRAKALLVKHTKTVHGKKLLKDG